MIKPASLRAAIVAMMPDLGRDPDRLMMWVDKGQIRATLTPNRGFSWSYTLNIVITAFARDPAALFFIVNEWLRDEQPDLLAAGQPGYSFEADILDAESCDLQIELPLSESVSITPRADGSGYDLAPVVELRQILDDEVPLAPAPSVLRRIFLHGEQIVPA